MVFTRTLLHAQYRLNCCVITVYGHVNMGKEKFYSYVPKASDKVNDQSWWLCKYARDRVSQQVVTSWTFVLVSDGEPPHPPPPTPAAPCLILATLCPCWQTGSHSWSTDSPLPSMKTLDLLSKGHQSLSLGCKDLKGWHPPIHRCVRVRPNPSMFGSHGARHSYGPLTGGSLCEQHRNGWGMEPGLLDKGLLCGPAAEPSCLHINTFKAEWLESADEWKICCYLRSQGPLVQREA